jgi:F-type H+-transporting ATPase subunit a
MRHILLVVACLTALAGSIMLSAGPSGEHGAPHGGGHHGMTVPEYFAGMVDHTQDHKVVAEDGSWKYLFDAHAPRAVHTPIYHPTKHRLMLLVTGMVMLLLFLSLSVKYKANPVVPRGKFHNLFDAMICYVRDDLVRPNLHGHHADICLPYFVFVFFFVLIANLLGLIPYPGLGGATGNIAVTAGLALITFGFGMFGGMIAQGPIKYWIALVPHGIPFPLIPAIFVIELVGLCTKHFALAVRLFANMIAGHIVISAIIGLIFLFGKVLFAPGAVGLALGISLLEVFVAFLQAYVFTLLSALFIGMALHPDH